MSNTLIQDTNNKKFGLTNNQLKIIACISMLIDHLGVAIFPGVPVLRIIGRLAFPIFAYMIAEGCRYTKNRAKYLGTMAAMALAFQVVYFVFMNDLYQGILVTFSLSIAIIFSLEAISKSANPTHKILGLLGLTAALFIGIACPIIFKKSGFMIDYFEWGIFLPVLIYFAPNKWLKLGVTAVLLSLMSIYSDPLQWWSMISVALLALYNGERGKAKMKYFFYIFYPAHLVVIYIIMFLIIILK
jgi:hypothetical protein